MSDIAPTIAEYLVEEIVPLIPHVALPGSVTPDQLITAAVAEHFGDVHLDVVIRACHIATEITEAEIAFKRVRCS